MPKTTFPAEGARKEVVIHYDFIESLQFFLAGDYEEDENAGYLNKQKTIPQHMRRRGPSDQAPINVQGSTATYLVDPSLKSGNARPGIAFYMTTTPLSDIEEKRNFMYTGRWLDLHAVLSADIKFQTYVYLSNGGRHTIEPGGENG